MESLPVCLRNLPKENWRDRREFNHHTSDSEMFNAIGVRNTDRVKFLLKNGDNFCLGRKCCFARAYETQDWTFVQELMELEPTAGELDGPYLINLNLKYPDRVRYLLDKGAKCDHTELDNVILKCSENHEIPSETLHVLIEHDAKMQYNDCLARACFEFVNHKVEDLVLKIEYLLEVGASKSSTIDNNEPLNIIVDDFVTEPSTPIFNDLSLNVCRKLLTSGVINVNREYREIYPLLSRVILSLRPVPDMMLTVLHEFLAAGLNSNGVDKFGDSILHVAAKITDPYIAYEVMRSLIEAGADPTTQDKNGDTAVRSIYRRHDELVPEMLKLFPEYDESQAVLYRALYVPGADLNAQDKNGNTALMLAANIHEDLLAAVDIIYILLDAGADPNIKNSDGRTALTFAIERKEMDLYYWMESIGNTSDDLVQSNTAIANRRDFYNSNSALLVSMVKKLIQHGADTSITFENGSLLTNAMGRFQESTELIELLLQNGADVNYVDEATGYTVLHYAVKRLEFPNGPEILKLLLKAGADPSKKCLKGNTPLHLACGLFSRKGEFKRDFDKITLLLNAGADPCVLNKAGENVLFRLARYDNFDDVYCPKILQTLIKAGVDINAKNSMNESPFIVGISTMFTNRKPGECFKLMKMFIENGANPSDRDRNGMTALMHVVSNSCKNEGLEAVKFLLAAGSDVNARDNNGHSVFVHVSIDKRSYFEILTELFKNGLDPKCTCKDNKPAIFSIIMNTPQRLSLIDHSSAPICDLLKIMYQCRVDFSVKKNGDTPLLVALKMDRFQCWFIVGYLIVTTLLKFKVNVNTRDNDGYSAIHLAIRNKIPRIGWMCLTALLDYCAREKIILDSDGHDILRTACTISHEIYGPKILHALLKAWRDSNNYRELRKVSQFGFAYAVDGGVVNAARNVKILIAAGFNPLELGTLDMDALTYVVSQCEFSNHYETVNILRNAYRGREFHDLPSRLSLSHGAQSMLTTNLFNYSESAYFIKHAFVRNRRTGAMSFKLNELVLKIMNYRFTICDDHPQLMSCVTALVSLKFFEVYTCNDDREKSYLENHFLTDMKMLILRGANPCQRLFTFRDPELQQLSQQLQLPDALWAAAISEHSSCVRELLRYWPSPPLALVLFVPNLREIHHNNLPIVRTHVRVFCNLISVLVEGWPLPPGSPFIQPVHHKFQSILQLCNDPSMNAIKNCVNAHYRNFLRMHSGYVPSLMHLSALKVRGCFSGSVDLPYLIARLHIPIHLINYLQNTCPPQPNMI